MGRKLYGPLFRALGLQRVFLIFYTITSVRRENLLTWCKGCGVNAEISTMGDIWKAQP
ncbi:hypothetical protein [Priestia endophytica]|uniref:hypothetical protein n=1 Tax=Priestia endophytica TaxID=135735 RepID=UPI002281DFC6|nr:hypothetical protein [Priestia endophytica]MCY8231627.1 hypothetical protein [Priestia endophytica]